MKKSQNFMINGQKVVTIMEPTSETKMNTKGTTPQNEKDWWASSRSPKRSLSPSIQSNTSQ